MAEVVLRVRLVAGQPIDVTYRDERVEDVEKLIDAAITALAADDGFLRTTHGGRTLVLYGRGVATLEVAPRGAVL